MARAVVDPAELRRFAHGLKHFNNELQHQLAVLHGQFSALGDTWRDQEHENSPASSCKPCKWFRSSSVRPMNISRSCSARRSGSRNTSSSA